MENIIFTFVVSGAIELGWEWNKHIYFLMDRLCRKYFSLEKISLISPISGLNETKPVKLTFSKAKSDRIIPP
jgi:hypothetical protein